MKVWIDGDTLVRKDGENQVLDELYGSGYTCKLKKFIAKRDQLLKEQEQQKNRSRINKNANAPEDLEERAM